MTANSASQASKTSAGDADVQLFHSNREGLQAQISKLGHLAENLNPAKQGSSSIGVEYLDGAGTDGLENVSQWLLCSSLDMIQLLHDYAVDNLDEIIPNWSSELFSEDPSHSIWRQLEANQDNYWPVQCDPLLPDLKSVSTDSMFDLDDNDSRTPPPLEEHIDDDASPRTRGERMKRPREQRRNATQRRNDLN